MFSNFFLMKHVLSTFSKKNDEPRGVLVVFLRICKTSINSRGDGAVDPRQHYAVHAGTSRWAALAIRYDGR